jgi:hypothetical protein
VLPERVADDDDRVRVRSLVLFGREGAAQRRFDAEHVEVIAAHQLAVDHVVLIARAEHGLRQAEREQPVERPVAGAVIKVIGVRIAVGAVAPAVHLEGDDEPLRFGHARERADDEGAHAVENGAVRADAQAERQHGGQREAGLFRQHSRAVA